MRNHCGDLAGDIRELLPPLRNFKAVQASEAALNRATPEVFSATALTRLCQVLAAPTAFSFTTAPALRAGAGLVNFKGLSFQLLIV